jgi:cell division initiation protein
VKLTPLDIQKHKFTSRMRGLDPVEVEGFLQLVAGDYESLIRERDDLRAKLRQLELRVEELSRCEKTLQDTLVTATALSEDLKRTAMREAELQVSEAEVKAEKILAAAHRRATRLHEDIRELKLVRTRLSASVRHTIETHLAFLDSLADASEDEAQTGPLQREA